MVDKVKQGKKNRASGADFERRTRSDLTDKGWIVDKWSNNVEFETAILASADNKESIRSEHRFGKLAPAKRKYAGPGRAMAIGTGFPDFKCHRFIHSQGGGGNCVDNPTPADNWINSYAVIGVECKTNGNLDKAEKEKCRWMLDNNIFGKILIASKTKVKNKIVIVYTDFKEKYGDVTTK